MVERVVAVLIAGAFPDAHKYRDAFRTALAALRSVPEGWQIVPVEPTPEMISAGWEHTALPCWSEDVAKAYRAMLSAAPKAK